MSQSIRLLNAVKSLMKSKGLTYSDLAQKLAVSESTAKRTLSGQITLSLTRLEEICATLGTDLFDLLDHAKEHREEAQLSIEQEELLANDAKAFVVFYGVLLGHDKTMISQGTTLGANETSSALRDLERAGLVDVHPHDVLKTKFSYHVRWQDGGPLSRAYDEQMKEDFLHSNFTLAEELFRFEAAHVTPHTLEVVRSKIEHLVEEVREMSRLDIRHHEGKTMSVSLLFAFRPWVPGVVRQYLKSPQRN